MKLVEASLLALFGAACLSMPAQGQQAGKLFFEGDLVKGPRDAQCPLDGVPRCELLRSGIPSCS